MDELIYGFTYFSICLASFSIYLPTNQAIILQEQHQSTGVDSSRDRLRRMGVGCFREATTAITPELPKITCVVST